MTQPIIPVSATPFAGGVPKAGGDGKLAAGWIPDLSAVYVDLTGAQTISGAKTFSSDVTLSGAPGKIKPAADSVTALQVAQADGTAFMTLDTSRKRVGLNDANPAAQFTITRQGIEDAIRIINNGFTTNALQVMTAPATTHAIITYDGRFQAWIGSQGTPSHSFHADIDTGMYWAGTNSIGFSTGGSYKGGVNADGLWTFRASDANTLPSVGILSHNMTDTPANNDGVALEFQTETSTTENTLIGRLRYLWTTITHASRTSSAVFSVVNAGTETDVLTLTPTEVVFGVAPVLPNNVALRWRNGSGNSRNTLNWSPVDVLQLGSSIGSGDNIVIQFYAQNTLLFSINGSNMTMADGKGITTGTTTGTRIGTATTNKLGFWNATPIVQPASANQAAVVTTAPTTSAYGYTEAQATAIITLLNEIRSVLVNTGLMKGAA